LPVRANTTGRVLFVGMFRWFSRNKSDADALMREAFALHEAGTLPSAEALYRKILQIQPGNHDALYLLGTIENERGNSERAIALFRDAIREHDQEPAFHQSLGDLLYRLNRWQEAAACYESTLILDPDRANTWNMLGCAYDQSELFHKAEQCFFRALEIEPHLVSAMSNMASAFCRAGQIDASVAKYRQALALAPDTPEIFSNFLFTLNLSTSLSPAEVSAEHLRYDELFGAGRHGRIARRAGDPDPTRRIRLAYASPDFNHHAVACFFEPLVAQHDAARFEVHCYYLESREDEVTARLKTLSPHWIECAKYSDAQLAARIEADQIDILVDLAGHTARNRLPVFARRPAPIQVTWLGYLNTSGLSAMDYRLTDAYADPPGTADHLYAEQLVRLPDCQWCYRYPGPTSPVSELPALSAGAICFGSFNGFQKLSEYLLGVWADVLLQLTDAKLLIVGVPRDEQQRLSEFFSTRGIIPRRLQMHDRMPLTQFRAMHRHVDIALDAHPYSGATTTCESLWMGVPTLTLTGASSISRSSSSLLQTLGLTEWISRTPAEFVELAKRNASNLQRLAALRAGLRTRMERSPLMDAARFARNIEDAYRSMWQAHCEQVGL
jgi:predicted O-linked N-acetylglucosamine transferase (SPINDLY family)